MVGSLESAPATAQPDDGDLQAILDPRELLRVLVSYKWLIATVALIIVAAVALYSFTTTAYYRADLRILIERESSRVVSFQEIYNLGSADEDYQRTQAKILESRATAAAAFANLSEADRKKFTTRSDPLDAFMELVKVLPVLKSRLIDVRAEHPDPEVAARMAESVVAAYVDGVGLRQHGASESALSKLRADAEDLHTKLIEAQRATQEFKKRHNIVSMNDRQSLAAARLEQLTAELADVERQRRDAESRLRISEQAIVDASALKNLPEVLASPVITSFKQELLLAQQEFSLLSEKYKPKHPRMLALARRIEAVEHQLNQEVEAIFRGQRHKFEQMQLHEQNVRERLRVQTEVLMDLETKSIEYQILRDEAENTRRLHDTILSRLKEVEVIDDYQNTNVHRIGTPEMSKGPVRPRTTVNLVLGLIGGLVFGSFLAFGVDICDRTLKTPADVTRLLELPILGTVPLMKKRATENGDLDPDTIDNRSTVSEAFRTIRTGLTFSECGRNLRSIVVTSSNKEEGKSLVAINLAVSMARGGKRVLLVDAEMRRGRLHRVFGLDNREGFSSVLLGVRSLRDTVARTEVDNLGVVPRGVIPPDPVELLVNGLTKGLLDEMFGAYDLVIFDSPPVGIVSDACVLTTVADRVIFVVRSLSTDRILARRAMQQLRNVGARFAGAILNFADSRADRYGGYGYDYDYEPTEDPEEVMLGGT